MKKIKLILFDIDNTLVFGQKALGYYGCYSLMLEKCLAARLHVPLQEATDIANDYRRRFNGRGEKSFEDLNLGMEHWYDAIHTLEPTRYMEPLPKVQAMLEGLKAEGYVLGAITDGPDKQAEKILKAAKIDKALFSIFIGWERGALFPKGGRCDVYEKILREGSYAPEEVLMVGDSIGADIIPAKKCGLNTVLIADAPNNAFTSIKTVLELPAYLKKYKKYENEK